MGAPLYVMCYFSLTDFSILSLSLIFATLIIMHLVVFLFALILNGTLYSFWTWMFVSFLKLGKLLAIIFSIMFSALFSSSGTTLMQISVHLMLPQSSLKLSSFLFTFFSSFFSMAVIYTILSSRSFTCSSALVILLLISSSAFFISVTGLFNAVCILVLLGLC